LTTREVALAAPEGGTRVLGFAGRIGRIPAGYKADSVVLDLDHPNWPRPTTQSTNPSTPRTARRLPVVRT